MCVACGAFIKQAPSSGENKSTAATGAELTMSGGQQLHFLNEAALLEQQKDKLTGLQKVRKLALILDLDHTLIHTTAAEYVPSDETLKAQEVHHLCIDERMEGHGGSTRKHYLVKKRPHLDNFLAEAFEHFQMTIYTAGTRKYAEAIAKLIDPTGKLFSGRMVSRSDIKGDKTGGHDKSLKRLFLGDASMAIILDDREDVWKGEQSKQLYVVKPFAHFTSAHEVNNAAGDTTSGSKVISMVGGSTQAAEDDDQLLRCLQVLEDIHSEYYASFDQITSTTTSDSPAVLSSSGAAAGSSTADMDQLGSAATLLIKRKQQVLAGCVVTFSGLIPKNERNPAEKCLLWRLALSLGAQVSVEVTSRTTHLVTVKTEAAKAGECHKRGDVWIVHPDWLMYSRWAVQKASESTFMVLAPVPGKALPEPILDSTPLPAELTMPLNTTYQASSHKRSRDSSGLGLESSEEDAELHKSIKKVRKLEQAQKNTRIAAEQQEDLERELEKITAAPAAMASLADADAASDGENSDSDDDPYTGDFDDLLS